MKKLVLLFISFMFVGLSYSQSNKEEIDLMQAAFGMEKKLVVEQFVHPTEAQKDAFWAIYDEYETKRKELGIKRIELLTLYANEWGDLDDEKSDNIMNQMLSLSASNDKNLVTYYKKIRKATSGTVALQFFQVESYILTTIRYGILSEIPFAGEK